MAAILSRPQCVGNSIVAIYKLHNFAIIYEAITLVWCLLLLLSPPGNICARGHSDDIQICTINAFIFFINA